MSENTERVQPVDVRNFDMSFGRMVVFMVKWAIATIPALLILIAVGYLGVMLIGSVSRGFDGYVSQSRSFTGSTAQLSDSEAAAELSRAEALLSAGKPWEAYGAARAVEGRTSGRRQAEARHLMDTAWKQTQGASP